MKILVLHSRLSGYWMACMRTFVDNYGGSFTVIRQKTSPNAPFDFSSTDNISLHLFDSFSKKELKNFCIKEDPDLIYVAGWIEQVYLSLARYFYKKGIPVLCGLDNQWKNTLRQKAGFLYLRYLLSGRFTHLLIPGLYQFEAARNLGFPKERILTGLYSADVPLFSKAIKKTPENYPRSFLFLGRLIPHKGLRELAKAFDKLRKQTNSKWSLTIVGNGPLRDELKQVSNIDILDFVQPQELPSLMEKHGVFVLPSSKEPWGVVIHEAAAAGLPIITTHQCGAATAFVRNGYNGFMAEAGNINSLFHAMEQITKKSNAELHTMGSRSTELAQQHTPASWSSSLFQLIENQPEEHFSK